MFAKLARCAAIGTVCVASVAFSQTLKVGDKAPPVEIPDWVKGEQVTGFEKGKVYVVEFWATWCPPCIESIPHLSKLQAQFKDQGVEIIGVTRPDARNTRDAVERFVKKQGDKMAYRVAFDTNGTTYERYMVAARQGGIPTAFIVDRKGSLAWIGHPMAMDKPLELIARGTWDAKKYAKGSVIQQQVQQHLRAGEFDAALEQLDTLIRDYPEMFGDDARLLKFQVLLYVGKADEAMKLGRELVDGPFRDNPAMLNLIAWGIATTPGEGRDLDLALKSAMRAVELAEGNEKADSLDTLARVYFERGDLDKAIQTQQKAIEHASGEQFRAQYEQTLKQYQAERDGG